jgi:hypothetical protein
MGFNDGLLPTQSEVIVDQRGIITRKFRDFLAQLATTTSDAALQAQITALDARVAALESDGGDLATFVAGTGISIIGQITDPIIRISLNAYLGDLLNVDDVTVAAADGDRLTWDAALGMWIPVPDSPSVAVLPLVTGEIDGGQPVFVYADGGSLIYTEIE